MSKVRFNKRDFDMARKVLSGRTLQDVGNEYRISRERVRQIVAKVKQGAIRSFDIEWEGTRDMRENDEFWMEHIEKFRKTRMDALI